MIGQCTQQHALSFITFILQNNTNITGAGENLHGVPLGPGHQLGYNMVPMKHVMTPGLIRRQNSLNQVGQTLSFLD